MNDLVSVIVAVYNAQEHLENCIASICSQTYTHLQIILIDDGSTDQSPSICDQWTKQDSRIITKHVENSGVSNARNLGIQYARGKYITFIDSDDWIENNFVEVLLCHHKKNHFTCCGYLTERFSQRGSIKFRPVRYSRNHTDTIAKQNVLSLYTSGLFNTVWNKLYEVSLLNEYNIRFPSEYCLGEDIIFNIQYLRILQGEIIVVNSLCYHYIIKNDQSLSQKYYKDFYDIQAYIFEMFLTYLTQIRAEKHQVTLARQLYFNALIASFDHLYQNRKNLVGTEYRDTYMQLVHRKELPNLIADMGGFHKIISLIRWQLIRRKLFVLEFHSKKIIKKILRLE